MDAPRKPEPGLAVFMVPIFFPASKCFRDALVSSPQALLISIRMLSLPFRTERLKSSKHRKGQDIIIKRGGVKRKTGKFEEQTKNNSDDDLMQTVNMQSLLAEAG